MISEEELKLYFSTIGFSYEIAKPIEPAYDKSKIFMCDKKKFIKVKELGKGSFGVVDLYESIDESKTKIAIKLARADNSAAV